MPSVPCNEPRASLWSRQGPPLTARRSQRRPGENTPVASGGPAYGSGISTSDIWSAGTTSASVASTSAHVSGR